MPLFSSFRPLSGLILACLMATTPLMARQQDQNWMSAIGRLLSYADTTADLSVRLSDEGKALLIQRSAPKSKARLILDLYALRPQDIGDIGPATTDGQTVYRFKAGKQGIVWGQNQESLTALRQALYTLASLAQSDDAGHTSRHASALVSLLNQHFVTPHQYYQWYFRQIPALDQRDQYDDQTFFWGRWTLKGDSLVFHGCIGHLYRQYKCVVHGYSAALPLRSLGAPATFGEHGFWGIPLTPGVRPTATDQWIDNGGCQTTQWATRPIHQTGWGLPLQNNQYWIARKESIRPALAQELAGLIRKMQE